jgi:hypothetical protein
VPLRAESRAMAHLLATAALLAISFGSAAAIAQTEGVYNLTGLPVYPRLAAARMDSVAKTDALGHWCTRFSAETNDALDVVEEWYRRALARASETDLNHDERYKNFPQLSGIKLALGVDSVTVYKAANQSRTSIELFKCSPTHQ